MMSIKNLLCEESATETKPTEYPCLICDKKFTNQLELSTHSHSRPFQCPGCEMKFVRKHDLVRHERIHLGIKPYSCPKCRKGLGSVDVGFIRKDALKRHLAMDPYIQRFRCAINLG